ncbi:unnamed protein product [Pedinophyceae sp. YPF-701]|nr:unnamed protein product [Pedinophyceae sp. YPF-701]
MRASAMAHTQAVPGARSCRGRAGVDGASALRPLSLPWQRLRSAPTRPGDAAPGRRTSIISSAAAPTKAPVPKSQGQGKKVVIVGGGIGGLVAGGLLAKQGMDVTILEKNADVGGRCQSETTAGGFRFDTGPSLLLFPDTYKQTFALLGEPDMERRLPVTKITPAGYRVHFGDGSDADMIYDRDAMCAQLEKIEPGAGDAYLQWLRDAENSLKLGMENFIEVDADNLLGLLRLDKLIPMVLKVSPIDLLSPHVSVLGSKFKDPRLKAMFTFQDLYVGLSPYNAPGVYSLLAGTELLDGVWYPKGGFQNVRAQIRQLAEENGARVQCNAEVQRVLFEGDRAVGVALAGGEEVRADVVMCNRDVSKGFSIMDNDKAKQRGQKIKDKWDYSCAVVSFNWGISKPVPELLHHNVFLSDDWEASWDRATAPDKFVKKPNFYVHSPCVTDPSAAPDGKASVMVLLPIANKQEIEKAAGRKLSDAEMRERLDAIIAEGRERVLDTFESKGIELRGHIEEEFIIDPVEWEERYGIEHGAVFGLSHGMLQLATFRPALKDLTHEGLYFVGASTRPGNGVPLVMISGRLAAERVLQDQGVAVPWSG